MEDKQAEALNKGIKNKDRYRDIKINALKQNEPKSHYLLSIIEEDHEFGSIEETLEVMEKTQN